MITNCCLPYLVHISYTIFVLSLNELLRACWKCPTRKCRTGIICKTKCHYRKMKDHAWLLCCTPRTVCFLLVPDISFVLFSMGYFYTFHYWRDRRDKSVEVKNIAILHCADQLNATCMTRRNVLYYADILLYCMVLNIAFCQFHSFSLRLIMLIICCCRLP